MFNWLRRWIKRWEINQLHKQVKKIRYDTIKSIADVSKIHMCPIMGRCDGIPFVYNFKKNDFDIKDKILTKNIVEELEKKIEGIKNKNPSYIG